MSSSGEMTRALMQVDHCHFPSLAFGPVSPSQPESLSSVLTPPTILRPGLTTEHLREAEVWKFAFVLLLKAYIRADTISSGLLYHGFHAEGEQSSLPSEAHILKATLDPDATLLENIQNLSTFPATSLRPETLKKELRLLEAESGSRPFNTMLCLIQDEAYEYLPADDLECNGLILCIGPHSTTTSENNQTRVEIVYKTNFLDKWSAENILATFQTILEIVAADTERPLKDVDLISARDVRAIHSWNSKVPTRVHQTLNDQFQGTFSENADLEAVYTTEGSLTYRELDDLSTVLAVRLMEAGVKPNTVVPIFMEKSRWSVCAIAAVWKSGGAITTMDPAYPDERLFDIIEEFSAKVIITDPLQRPRFDEADVRIISDVGRLPTLLERETLPVSRADAWKMSGVKPTDLAVVAFTSGSSGKPKGVLHSHERLTSEHQSYSWNVEYTKGSRVLQFASYAYIASVGETQRVFSHGITLCVPSEEERMSTLVDFIKRSRATRCYLTPSLVRTLNPKDVPSLKILCVGGEPIPKDLETIWGPHVHFIQVYGATEGGFLAKDRTSKTHNKKGLTPVGGLTWIVDSQDSNKLVPIGAVGEMVFESHELALGYLNDPEKSAKTFLDPPAWARDRPQAAGCRYLRNGDMGRYEADGSVSIIGRADTQIKINGQRVELGDVESNLRVLLPKNWALVVELVRPLDASDRPVLTAFIRPSKTFDGEVRIAFSDALKRLGKVLPRHMIPRALVVVDQIPGNYKTDRRKLRTEASELGYKKLIASLLVDGGQDNRPIPPTNETEQVLAELWATILRQDLGIVGIRQDFISLGGDSLAAIKLVSAARRRNLHLTTQLILSYPILQDMAKLASQITTDDGVDSLVKDATNNDISPSNVVVSLRATEFQEWAALVGSVNGGWVDHLVYDFSGKLDEDRLQESCKSLVETHSILRSVFRLQEGRVVLEVTSGGIVPFEIHQVDVQDLESKTSEIYAKDRVSPLGKHIVRFDLLRASTLRHRLIMRLSHAQYDGFCVDDFEHHLKLLYFSQKLPPSLPFHEYVRQIHHPKLIQEADAYWRDNLKGSNMPQLVKTSGDASTFTNTLDGELKQSVVIPSLRQKGISSASVVKAAWALVVSALSRSADIVFGDFISGRQVPIRDVETVMGACVNFMPLRVHVSEQMSNSELLENVQRDLIAAIPHETLGFKHIIQNCTRWGKDARYSSIVNFVNLEREEPAPHVWTVDGNGGGKLEVVPLYEEQQHDKADLWLLCRRTPAPSTEVTSGTAKWTEKLDLYFRYSTALYNESAIRRITSLYSDALGSLVTSLDERVRVPKISKEEEQSLLGGAR